MKATDTALADKMLRAADAEPISETAERLRTLANNFTTAAVGFYSEPQTVAVGPFFQAWASARLFWYKYSGEPLI